MVTRALVATALLLLPAAAPAQPPASQRPRAIVAEYDGIIQPVAAEFFANAIDRAEASRADVVVIVLRTPGGLVDSMQSIVSRMIVSRPPVVVFVGPSGARAASAGFILALAADVAVMAPGTHIGAAHPVSGTGQPMDETTAKKAASDAAAYARSLAESRGRNVTLAAEAVTDSRAFTDREALQATPPLIDFVARDVDDVLRQLNDRPVRRFDGHTVALHTDKIEITRVTMTRRQQFLSAIANPQIAYILMSLGVLGLTVELWNPGAILPGVVGGLSLLLAFFAFQVLPVNTIGLLLMLFGVALLLLELKVPSFGVLGVGGTISLVVGSIMMTGSVPGVPVALSVIVPVALSLAGILLFLGRLALAARRVPVTTGAEGLVGTEGRTLTSIAPDTPGQVSIHGEIWRALSRQPLPSGARIRVASVTGLTVLVEPIEPVTPEGGLA